jgi:hypothetical protein
MELLKFPTTEQRETNRILARKAQMMEVLCAMIELVEEGEITEFVCASIDGFGDMQVHLCASDYISGVGMFELGKQTLVNLTLDGEEE